MTDTKIHFILTGGRIDSVWDGGVDEIVVAEHSVIPSFIKTIGLTLDITYTEICMKDSRALTQQDRESMRKLIDESDTPKIVITHGTHTLPDTVQYLHEKLEKKDKTIIFTGASAPLKDFAISDAGFNLGYAIAKVQELPAGMYLCISGKTTSFEEMQKQLKEGSFYTRSSS